MKTSFLAGLAVALAIVGATSPLRAQDAGDTKALQALIDAPERSEKNSVRDKYRHPLEVLTFFGVKPDQTVVEILPGAGGYWTEILAPYLKAHGHYIAANNEKSATSAEARDDNAALAAKLAANPGSYDKVEVTEFGADRVAIAPPGSADVVLTFRNVHNWMAAGETAGAFSAFYKALKPGGVLGIEEHRGRANQPQDPQAKSGYVREDVIIGFAEAAGFRFAGSSEVNANPKDTKDYPGGVWTLPPTFRLKDVDRAKYAAIGESDRAILKFVKP